VTDELAEVINSLPDWAKESIPWETRKLKRPPSATSPVESWTIFLTLREQLYRAKEIQKDLDWWKSYLERKPRKV